jgi:hypothetical protein
MITSKSSRLNSQGFSRFTRWHRRLILFVAPLAIALVLTLAFGLVGRTVTAQKGARDAAEAALKGKADFLLRETYRAARTIKQQPTTTTEAESNLRVEDEIHSLSKIIDIKSQRTGSIRVSVAVRLASGADSE